MTKRLQPILVVAMVLLVPALVFAGANKFAVAKGSAQEGKLVLDVAVSNARALTCLDVPLRYSEGVTLEKVTFEGTRVGYFDFKSAYIVPEERSVFIGLIAQFSAESKPDLAAGEGAICQLHFTVDDPSITSVTIEALQTKNPNHTLTYVYREDGRSRAIYPEFSSTTVSLTNPGELPQAYALRQNYPNPFNPTTIISFDMKKAGEVNLAVYNVLGQKLFDLVNGKREAGSYEVECDLSMHSSGVYFYRLETGDFTKTRKMMVLK